jgi:uncharacterized protein (TIGR02452 family)
MADDKTPMGSVGVGSPAQEESLCRDSTLCLHIGSGNDRNDTEATLYPILNDEVLYSPGVIVFKRDRIPLQLSFEVDVISCPGLRHPRLTKTGRMSDDYANTLRRKVRAIFQVAQRERVTYLVLGALGCGSSWRPSPERQVAEIFRETCLRHPRLEDSAFELVVFAILPHLSLSSPLPLPLPYSPLFLPGEFILSPFGSRVDEECCSIARTFRDVL